MSFTTREYARTVTMTKSQLENMIIAQNGFERYWKGQTTKASFQASISGLAGTILGLVFKSTTVGIIVAVVSSVLGEASTSYKQTVATTATRGTNQIVDLFAMMKKHSNYASLEVELPYLEFRDNKTGNLTTIVSGFGIIKKINIVGGGWI